MIAAVAFSNPPEAANPGRYDEARDTLSAYLRPRSDVLSLYEFGTVKAPGVSDLDLIVVAADCPEPDIAAYLAAEQIPPLVRRMMNGGTLMVMRAAEFRAMRWWDDVNVCLLQGKAYALENPSDTYLDAVEVSRVVDWLPERTARLLSITMCDTVPVQQALCLMHSVSYTFHRLTDTLAIIVPDISTCIVDIAALRNHWFDMDDRERHTRLVELVERVPLVAMQALHAFGVWCVEKEIYDPPDGADKTLTLGRRMRLEFVSDRRVNIETALSLSSADVAVVPVPRILWSHFAAYAAGSGPIARSLAGCMSSDTSGGIAAPVMRDVLATRIDMVERMASYLRRNGFITGLWKMGWFL